MARQTEIGANPSDAKHGNNNGVKLHNDIVFFSVRSCV